MFVIGYHQRTLGRLAGGWAEQQSLAVLTNEFWRALQVPRARHADRNFEFSSALHTLVELLSCQDHDRLRCAAGGALVSLGLVHVRAGQ